MAAPQGYFVGKKVLVTGASRGIGRGITKRLVELGATVFGLGRNPKHLEELKNEFPSVTTLRADMGEWETVVEAVRPHLPFHALVNNAAIARPTPFLDATADDLDAMYNINFKGVVMLSQAVAKSMIENKIEGSIVNISSATSSQSFRLAAISGYAGLKAGLNRVTQLMAFELGPHGIRVNTVGPGYVAETDLAREGVKSLDNPQAAVDAMNAMAVLKGEALCPTDIGDAVVFFLSDKSLKVTGQTLFCDKGLM